MTTNLSLSQAESLCDADVRCVGFTYPSKDPAVPAGPVPCTLKRAAKLYFTSDEWQTYLRPVHAVARPQLNGRPHASAHDGASLPTGTCAPCTPSRALSSTATPSSLRDGSTNPTGRMVCTQPLPTRRSLLTYALIPPDRPTECD